MIPQQVSPYPSVLSPNCLESKHTLPYLDLNGFTVPLGSSLTGSPLTQPGCPAGNSSNVLRSCSRSWPLYPFLGKHLPTSLLPPLSASTCLTAVQASGPVGHRIAALGSLSFLLLLQGLCLLTCSVLISQNQQSCMYLSLTRKQPCVAVLKF